MSSTPDFRDALQAFQGDALILHVTA